MLHICTFLYLQLYMYIIYHMHLYIIHTRMYVSQACTFPLQLQFKLWSLAHAALSEIVEVVYYFFHLTCSIITSCQLFRKQLILGTFENIHFQYKIYLVLLTLYIHYNNEVNQRIVFLYTRTFIYCTKTALHLPLRFYYNNVCKVLLYCT